MGLHGGDVFVVLQQAKVVLGKVELIVYGAIVNVMLREMMVVGFVTWLIRIRIRGVIVKEM